MIDSCFPVAVAYSTGVTDGINCGSLKLIDEQTALILEIL